MSNLDEQLIAKISAVKGNLRYEELFKWLEECSRLEVVANANLYKNYGDQKDEAIRVYHGFQAFHFGLKSRGIETLTLEEMIYPAWVRFLRPHLKDYCKHFDLENLSHISDNNHLEDVFRAFVRLSQKYAGPIARHRPARAALHGSLLDLDREYPPSPFAE